VLDSNLDGYSNTASGWEAMYFNTHGYDNTASGYGALYLNDSGHHNTAFGTDALYSINGINSTGVGAGTLFNSTTGNNNSALGYDAGYKLTTGSDNIHIGNEGAAADNKVIKIGTKGSQTKTYIAGIYTNTAVSGLAVVIGANGELGAVASSERFKTDIARMGTSTEKLQQLRPVTFHYKNDQQRELRYGLIAEEVASVYPELAIRDENGRIDGVRYDELAPMLLNEVQQQQKKMAAQDQRSAAQDAKIGQLMEQLVAMHAALDKLQSKDELVAKR